MKRLSRRTVLRGAAGVALGLPLLEAMMPAAARAQDAALPRRLIFVFKPNGDQVSQRMAVKGETNFQFGEFLSPLEPYRQDLLVMEGISKRFGRFDELELADNHEQGGSALGPWPSGSGSFPVGGANRNIGYILGPTADIAIGDRVKRENANVLHRSLVYRVGDRNNNIWNIHAHGGPEGTQNPLAPVTDPYAAYAQLFSTLGQGTADAAVKKRIAMKQSALDLVIGEATSLRNKLGTADRQRLDRHTDALRDLEKALQSPGSSALACKPADLGAKLDPYNDDNHAVVGQLFFKIIALAYACDLTRVAQFNWSGNTNDRVYKTLGLTEGHHTISHNSDVDSFTKIRAIKKHLWTLSTKLYEELKATPEVTGTLWDHTLVVHWDELDQGDTHADDNNLVIFAGKAHDTFRRGRYLDFSKNPVNGFADMLVSCHHAMGFTDVTRFGDPRVNSGQPLPNLT